MSKSLCFYDRHQIGTSLIGMPESVNSGGAGVVMGLDRENTITEELNPNFENLITVIVGFQNHAWTQRSFNKHIYSLHRELRRFRREHGSGWLCWVDSNENLTTTLNSETAGSNVQIDVASISALDIQAGDYVLAIPPEGLSPLSIEAKSQVLEVTGVGGADFTVATLGVDLPSGSTIRRVLVAWEASVWRRSNTGQPPEQSADFYRFSTTWEFSSKHDPVMSVSE